jgi:capsule polysaccharide export protein KpsE/RkpR
MDNLNTLDIIKIIIKNWKQIAIVTLIGIVVGIAVALIKKPLFKSQAVLYPYNITHFSEESPTETLDEFVESPEMMYLMDAKFKLGKHYGLDTTSASYKENLKQLYQENFNYTLTSNRSLEIEVYDTDPKLAQKYCQGVIKCIDEMFTKQLTLKSIDELKLWQIQRISANNKIDSLRKALNEMSEKYGLLNFYTQTKEASKVQYKLISKGQSPSSNKEFNDLLVGLRTKGFEFYMLDNEYNSLISLRTEAIVSITKIERDLKKKFTYSMVVSAPDLPIKKSKPIRWIIVLSFAVSSFVFGLLLLFFRENRIFEKLKV